MLRLSAFFLGTSLLLTFSLICFPSSVQAGPLGCANAIQGCVGGGKKVAEKIKNSRQACEALRDCKNVCKDDKRDAIQETSGDHKACLNSCDSLGGKKKHQCESECRQEKRSEKKDAHQEKRSCVDICRDNYKTKSCKEARFSMATTIAAQGLKCAAQVSAQCGPSAP